MGLETDLKDPGKDWPQILAIIVACIPGLTSALLFTWSSPFILVLKNDKKTYSNISEEDANLIPIFMPIGMMVSSLFFFKIHDLIGRKYSLVLLSIPHTIFWIITIFASDTISLCIGRFICGMADAIVYAALPIYLGEVATPRIRGTWGTGQSFSFNAGFVIINVLGYYFNIKQTAYICITLPVVGATLFMLMPESPYHYLVKNEDEKAKRSLQWLLRKKNIEPDFLQLKADVKRQISETGTWADLVKIVSNRKALTACLFLRFGQQASGVGVFENYIQYIFEKAQITVVSPEMSAIVFSATLLIVMSFFSIFMDKMGRRKAFISSSLGCALCLTAESIYFYLDDYKIADLSSIEWFPLAAFVGYVIFYCAGLGPLPGLMNGELFSASIKGKALAISSMITGLYVTLTSFSFRYLITNVGLYAPFAVFAAITFMVFVGSFFVVPETKGKTLEEIQQDLKGHKKGF